MERSDQCPEPVGKNPRTGQGQALNPKVIGTLRGVGGRGVGDYTSLNYGLRPPTPSPPTKGPYDNACPSEKLMLEPSTKVETLMV